MKCIETYVTLCAVFTLIFCGFKGLVLLERRVKHAKFGLMYSLDSLLYTITMLFIFTILCKCNDMYLYFDKRRKSAILYACIERLNRGNTHTFFKTICCKSISLINRWAMAVVLQSLVLTLAAMQFFFSK